MTSLLDHYLSLATRTAGDLHARDYVDARQRFYLGDPESEESQARRERLEGFVEGVFGAQGLVLQSDLPDLVNEIVAEYRARTGKHERTCPVYAVTRQDTGQVRTFRAPGAAAEALHFALTQDWERAYGYRIGTQLVTRAAEGGGSEVGFVTGRDQHVWTGIVYRAQRADPPTP